MQNIFAIDLSHNKQFDKVSIINKCKCECENFIEMLLLWQHLNVERISKRMLRFLFGNLPSSSSDSSSPISFSVGIGWPLKSHVTFGIGSPLTSHQMVTFCPSSAVISVIFSVKLIFSIENTLKKYSKFINQCQNHKHSQSIGQ